MKYVAWLLASIGSLPASAAVIDFSTDTNGNVLSPLTVIDEQYATLGVHFIGSAFDEPDNPQDNFASNADMRLTTAGGDVPMNAVIPVGAGNFLHTYSGFQAEDGDNNFAIVFDAPVTSVSIDIYDDIAGLTQMFAIEGEDILDATQSFDSDNAAPQTLTVAAPSGFTVVGVILGSNIDWVGADNLTFTAVPEPATLAASAVMMASLRRRRTSIAKGSHSTVMPTRAISLTALSR